MSRKEKYQNADIVRQIFAREYQAMGNLEGSIVYRFLDLKKKKDRAFLAQGIKQMIEMYQDALKELERWDYDRERNYRTIKFNN